MERCPKYRLQTSERFEFRTDAQKVSYCEQTLRGRQCINCCVGTPNWKPFVHSVASRESSSRITSAEGTPNHVQRQTMEEKVCFT